jgi:predicted RecB family nuclease
MKGNSRTIQLSASDLANHLACRHTTSLDLSVVSGLRPAPQWHSPDAHALQQRGAEHELAYTRYLAAQGLRVVHPVAEPDGVDACGQTEYAMRSGADVIVQASLRHAAWFGRADILRRVEKPSSLGAWSYEVQDCKLAVETRGTTILQLLLYSELLAGVQGAEPEFMHVVPPDRDFALDTFRVSEFAAYYRYVKHRLEQAVESRSEEIPTYPEPAEHCSVCRWWSQCDAERRADDHLSFVAGISRMQQDQLSAWDVTTLAELARLPLPLQHRPERGSKESYLRVREQARVQLDGRLTNKPVHELLPVESDFGFCKLPLPSPGDIYFDLEGDPFIGSGGREYLFGLVAGGESEAAYHSHWALDPAGEKLAFEWFVDLVMERWAQWPGMHIYHFTGYEPGALKRLMGRYATREDEVDKMLRASLFVDLHSITKRALRASVESYSLKALEIFHGFKRQVELERARTAMYQLQHRLELGGHTKIEEKIKELVAAYNADDCLSTRALHLWLEAERARLEQAGQSIPGPQLTHGEPPDDLTERQQRIANLVERLRTGIPEDETQRNEEQSARWLLSNLVDWHRREAKSEWHEYFRLSELSDDDLLEERSALGGLHFQKRLEPQKKTPVDRYGFDKQETCVRIGDELHVQQEKLGTVVAIDMVARTVDIKKAGKFAESHPPAVYVKSVGPRTKAHEESLFSIASWVDQYGMASAGPYRAGRDLLLRATPRFSTDTVLNRLQDETNSDVAVRVSAVLHNSFLAIQGPPGAGKTHTAARMICRLVASGKRVGITASNHKVIGNLLAAVLKAAETEGLSNLHCIQKVKKEEKPEVDLPHIQSVITNNEALAAFTDAAHLLAGTSWLWADQKLAEAVDVLFIDEAGQMSLANVLAISQASKSLVLLGDPQQLDQPLKGSHPDGAEASALEHVLGGLKTIVEGKGLFLEKTWRLHPKLCRFTSETFYESRLTSVPGLDRQRILGHPWLPETGLVFAPVLHHGNQNSSKEEVDAVGRLFESLTSSDLIWTNSKGEMRPLRANDIVIVAPYNAQISDLAERLPGARIGTVDKFQGQESPVVIYSLTTSSPEDAPRGMEFLYSLNRLNVATSRAQALCILIASPRLMEPECHTPRQMQLANALCRYREMATTTSKFLGAMHARQNLVIV